MRATKNLPHWPLKRKIRRTIIETRAEDEAYLLHDTEIQDGRLTRKSSGRRIARILTPSRIMMVLLSVAVLAALWKIVRCFGPPVTPVGPEQNCDFYEQGYKCQPNISHNWGQYSPYFSVPSEIPADVPDGCNISFVQVLSRHGARDPTASKSAMYKTLITKMQSRESHFPGIYSFLQNYHYNLGADQLTTFGQQEMVNSGIKFYGRYQNLTYASVPFFRASGQERVIDSAVNFTQGLSHGLCTDFETERSYDTIANQAQKDWASEFVPPIQTRLNSDLVEINLTVAETISLMDLCPFDTVASSIGRISLFCDLFLDTEWPQYNYYQSLGKYYGYSNGNPLGPTQGVGFANELVARMTNKPVKDHTSVNHTLDANNATFPIGGSTDLYADFSHDNDMTAIFSALGLYNTTAPLDRSMMQTIKKTNGYSAAWTVPFAARAYFEKMTCSGATEEYVRVLVNDRVLPLETCGGDALGRCTLSKFVGSLSFAQAGGDWDKCFSKVSR